MAKVHTKIKKRWGIHSHVNGHKVFEERKPKITRAIARAAARVSKRLRR